jgi:hypothetical protein
MGVKKPSKSVTSAIFNYVSGRLVSRSGEQLQLIDVYDKENKKSMLEVLSDPGNLIGVSKTWIEYTDKQE